MVDYKYKDLFLKSHIDKQMKIATDDGSFTATNSDIHVEDFELTESLCSDSELRFGSCEASMVKFQIRNAFIPLAGKWLTVTETLEGNTDAPFQYGRYKVFSDVPTADKEYRDIVAYDAMYDILGTDMAAWYNTILPDKDSKVTLKQFREAFIRHFGLTEVLPKGGLVNDDMVIEKTIDIMVSSETETEQTSIIGDALSGKDVITAICEINGCFGHIGRDGKFYYVYLPQAIQGLYPANDLFPSDTLYPRDPKGVKVGGNGTYINVQWEDYDTKPISKLQIRQEENDIGLIYGSGDNTYIIQGNFLVYGKSSDQLYTIAENIYSKIKSITYIPLKSCEAAGNPCFEVGDPIRMSTKYALIETYILERTLKGIQTLRDTYKSNGAEKYAENVNSVHQSILQLKGKANILTRTIEETRLEMIDMGEGLSNTISITAKELRGELKNTKEGLETQISVTAAGIHTEASQTYETKTNASNEYTSIRSSITQNANSITAEVTRASSAEGNLSSRITITENGLSSKVTKGNISSEISQEAGKVSIKSNRFSLESTNCTITEDGKITAKSIEITGGKINLVSQSEAFSDITLNNSMNGYCKMNAWEISVYTPGLGYSDLSAGSIYVYKNSLFDGSYITTGGIYTPRLYSNATGPYGEIEVHSKISFLKDIDIGVSKIKSSAGTVEIENLAAKLPGFESGLSYVKLGHASGTIGFFGNSGSGKKTIAKASTLSSVTASSVATTVNNLIDALKAYNLIG